MCEGQKLPRVVSDVPVVSRDLHHVDSKHFDPSQARRVDATGALAGGVAHDFNNLLMIIGAYAELALDAMASEDPIRHNLRQILAATLRATDLTRQLQVFGRQPPPTMQVISLNSIVEETCRLLPKLLGKRIGLEVALGKGLGQIK